MTACKASLRQGVTFCRRFADCWGGEIGGEQVRLLTLVQVCVLVVISADSG